MINTKLLRKRRNRDATGDARLVANSKDTHVSASENFGSFRDTFVQIKIE